MRRRQQHQQVSARQTEVIQSAITNGLLSQLFAICSDSCRNDCTSATCGDGVIQSGEECDDGNNSNNDSCTNACKNARVSGICAD
jgi:cysteine-rich repeat protein